MKYLMLLLITPILIFSQITEDLSGNKQLVTKKLYTKGSFVFGPGFEKIKVGEKQYEDSDRDNQDINIMPGGGAGVEAVIGYDLSNSLAFEFSIGLQNSGSFIDEDNKAQFKKSQIRASVLYKIPTGKKYVPYVGAGLSTILSGKYVENSKAGEGEVKYTKPSGFHILGGAEWKNPNSPLYWFGEMRLLILGEFEVDESDISYRTLEDFGMMTMSANMPSKIFTNVFMSDIKSFEN